MCGSHPIHDAFVAGSLALPGTIALKRWQSAAFALLTAGAPPDSRPVAGSGSGTVTLDLPRNPRRRCKHCLAGETPVLLADGGTMAIADLRVGDAVIGTVRSGDRRRYAVTTVQEKWSTVQAAYQVTLDDGTKLVTSGEHRFLTDRGWKHVVGAISAHGSWPYLTRSDRLMGPGGSATDDDAWQDINGLEVTSNQWLGVRQIEPLGARLELWDITTGSGDYVAGGVVSHTCSARDVKT